MQVHHKMNPSIVTPDKMAAQKMTTKAAAIQETFVNVSLSQSVYRVRMTWRGKLVNFANLEKIINYTEYCSIFLYFHLLQFFKKSN